MISEIKHGTIWLLVSLKSGILFETSSASVTWGANLKYIMTWHLQVTHKDTLTLHYFPQPL